MGLILDSSVLIAAERGRFDLEGLVRSFDPSGPPAAISTVVAAELLEGFERADTPERRAKRQLSIEAALQRFQIIPFELEDARVHASIKAQLAQPGQ